MPFDLCEVECALSDPNQISLKEMGSEGLLWQETYILETVTANLCYGTRKSLVQTSVLPDNTTKVN